MGWKTWSGFALVGACGVAVFMFLPRWVAHRPLPEARSIDTTTTSTAPEIVEAREEAQEITPPPPPGEAEEAQEAEEERIAGMTSFPEVVPRRADPSQEAFAAAMTEALDALTREEYALAREKFEQAKTLRPEAREAASGILQAEEGLRNRAIAGHRDRALEHERLESWRAAEAEYQLALAIDPSLRFAQEGTKRNASRALLQEKLEFQIGHPERLSDVRAHEEASRLLDEARGVEAGGPKHRQAIAALETLVASYSSTMEVLIVSDRLTEVTLHRVGPLGRFDRRVLEIRPGRYVAVGTRPGFRDVRVEFEVVPGKSLAPIGVRCEEAI